MDPSVAAALSMLASAVSTALLMYSAYHWPAGRNEHEDDSGAHQTHQHRRLDENEQDNRSE